MLQWVKVAASILPMVVSAVQWVEQFVRGESSQAKQDSAVEVIRTLLSISRSTGIASAESRLADPDTDRVVRQIVDLVVLLENTVAKKRAAA